MDSLPKIKKKNRAQTPLIKNFNNAKYILNNSKYKKYLGGF